MCFENLQIYTKPNQDDDDFYNMIKQCKTKQLNLALHI